jgi:hypothetical protein
VWLQHIIAKQIDGYGTTNEKSRLRDDKDVTGMSVLVMMIKDAEKRITAYTKQLEARLSALEQKGVAMPNSPDPAEAAATGARGAVTADGVAGLQSKKDKFWELRTQVGQLINACKCGFETTQLVSYIEKAMSGM